MGRNKLPCGMTTKEVKVLGNITEAPTLPGPQGPPLPVKLDLLLLSYLLIPRAQRVMYSRS